MGLSSDPDQRRTEEDHDAWIAVHGCDCALFQDHPVTCDHNDPGLDIFDGRATGFGRVPASRVFPWQFAEGAFRWTPGLLGLCAESGLQPASMNGSWQGPPPLTHGDPLGWVEEPFLDDIPF